MALYAFPGIDEAITVSLKLPLLALLTMSEHDLRLFICSAFINKGEAPRIIIPCDNTDSMSVDSVGDIRITGFLQSFACTRSMYPLLQRTIWHNPAARLYYARVDNRPEGCVSTGLKLMASTISFVFPRHISVMFATPDAGCWLGASPELLIRRGRQQFAPTTMPLAALYAIILRSGMRKI